MTINDQELNMFGPDLSDWRLRFNFILFIAIVLRRQTLGHVRLRCLHIFPFLYNSQILKIGISLPNVISQFEFQSLGYSTDYCSPPTTTCIHIFTQIGGGGARSGI